MSSKRPSTPTRPAGFTLIELIVVVSIVLLLLAVMAPSVNTLVEYTRGAICGNNLHQLAGMLRIEPEAITEGCLPRSSQWMDFVTDHGAGDTLVCPSDNTDNTGTLDLSDVWLVQGQGSARRFSNIQAVLDTGRSSEDSQVRRTDYAHGVTAGPGQALILIGSECALIRVTYSGEIRFESLIVVYTHSGHRSTHWLCVDDGAPNWRARIVADFYQGTRDSNVFVMRFQGVGYNTKWPDYVLSYEHSSYAMSDAVNVYTPRPGQLMLVEYKKPVAKMHRLGFGNDLLGDDNDDDYGCLRTRHRGRANLALTDGSVKDLTREQLQVEYDRYTVSDHNGIWAP